MLVLTRKPGEQLIINGNIKVTVVTIGSGRIRIGVEAPEDVTIDRAEIFEKKQVEKQPEPATLTADQPVEVVAEVQEPLEKRFPRRTPSRVVPAAAHKTTRPSYARKPR